MSRADQIEIRIRIVIEQPVIGVRYSLQAKDDGPENPKTSDGGEQLSFELPIRIAPGPKYFGDHVRREGAERRFVYIRIGQLAGDPLSPWSRRMKIDIHDIERDLLDIASACGGVIEIVVDGTARDGTPSCATVRPIRRAIG